MTDQIKMELWVSFDLSGQFPLGRQAGAEGGHWQVGVLGHFAQTGGASSIQYRWVDNIDRIIMIIRNTLILTRVDIPTFL